VLTARNGRVITNRVGFTPYGETSFGRAPRRFTGMERDEESGLNYHPQYLRYGASHESWQPARASSAMTAWHSEVAGAVSSSSDPFNLNSQESNLYAYVLGNPPKYRDPKGLSPENANPNELKPDTPSHEIAYGALQLFLESDLAMSKHLPAVLSPVTSPNVPTAAKLGYVIFVAPFAIVGAAAVGVGEHVGKSTYHIVKGSSRLVWQGIKYVTTPVQVPGPPALSAANINIEPQEDTEMRFAGGSQTEPPPAEPPRRSIQQRPNVQAARPNLHGCQFGPDSPDPRSRKHSADLWR